MPYSYLKYNPEAFKQQPASLDLNGRRIEFMGFCRPENWKQTPIAILGGAFQSFKSFKKDVEILSESHPVILLDLPGQGCNEQLGTDLCFLKLSELMHEFFQHFDIPKVSMIGLSYGSAIAYQFAGLYPSMLDRLVLGGTTTELRPTVCRLLEDSFQLLDSDDFDTFSQGAVMNLLNYPLRKKTRIPSRVIKQFCQNLKSMSKNEMDRYIENSKRLISFSQNAVPPQCPTIVLTGEYDSFTTPYENSLVANRIKDSVFILVKKSDHLASLERRSLVSSIYSHFFNSEFNQKMFSGFEGIIENAHEVVQTERRHQSRIPLQEKVQLIDQNGSTIGSELVDISPSGARIKSPQINEWHPNQLPYGLKFHGELLSCHLFQSETGDDLQVLFRKRNFKEAERIEKLVHSLS